MPFLAGLGCSVHLKNNNLHKMFIKTSLKTSKYGNTIMLENKALEKKTERA